jgi:hypothetical protein
VLGSESEGDNFVTRGGRALADVSAQIGPFPSDDPYIKNERVLVSDPELTSFGPGLPLRMGIWDFDRLHALRLVDTDGKLII